MLILAILIILSLNLFDFLSWFILLSLRYYNFLNLIAYLGKSRMSLTNSLASPLRSKYPSFVGCFRIHRDWFN